MKKDVATPCAEAEIPLHPMVKTMVSQIVPLQPMAKTMVRQAVPLKPMDVHSGADIHLQPMEEPMVEQVDGPEAGCDLVENPHWSGLLAGPVERVAHTGAGLLAGIVTLVGHPCWSSS
ncbi:hypothetical protein AV530_017824 [Patagioenas fasciata monilis]|uniref:Uncharacterized protein n=1 Tax=Patagioenas fasciata monilis TaxID=372326 RepID=A0A1V4KZJ1_PATFA|nr:hypothetical protein AV530_017824 [Patagioenas fasciata monilis]